MYVINLSRFQFYVFNETILSERKGNEFPNYGFCLKSYHKQGMVICFGNPNNLGIHGNMICRSKPCLKID